MVADNIRNAQHYYGLGKGIECGLKFLQTQDIPGLDLGRHEIDGDNCFAIVMEYDSKPIEQGVWEAHRRYVDIQYIAEGVERIGYADIKGLSVSKEYDDTKDAELLAGDGNMMVFKTGTFGIYMPHDGHMPMVAAGQPSKVRKVVVKVKEG
ncbi:MAG: YhcH/YjgK/YiaL family protein [Armatimonadetes bacterium]|nr:YhcH/YjgK/YiaL family protein [Armatimonadota bacterium]